MIEKIAYSLFDKDSKNIENIIKQVSDIFKINPNLIKSFITIIDNITLGGNIIYINKLIEKLYPYIKLLSSIKLKYLNSELCLYILKVCI